MEKEVALARLKSGAFEGRTDWLQHWNKKTKRFEAMDTPTLMMLMTMRQLTKAITDLPNKISC